MKIVKISGGLGNQMFQYAFARELEWRTMDEVYLDISTYNYQHAHNGFELAKIFPIQYRKAKEEDIVRLGTRPNNLLSKLRRKYLTKKTHHIDRKFRYDEEIFELKGDRYFEGWWQSEKYFADVATDIRERFTFAGQPGDRNVDLLASIGAREATAVSVHVRRGDFLKLPETMVCGREYYENAFREIGKRVMRPAFIIFSDDIRWCRANLDTGGDAVFVDWNSGNDSWRDMWLMSRCGAHIVANSSFSWWSAWLDPSPQAIVVAPDKWSNASTKSWAFYRYDFSDIVPPGWIRVETGRAKS
jgi:hypothetical protein